ncbi:MAG: hypothetical protein ABIN91_23385 [Mucilaginibacter sp.]|uniref:hypothetical protein n=1 Tax=Mucilaginibacter sp. TaxID=1882438 RepID=UPI00326727A9
MKFSSLLISLILLYFNAPGQRIDKNYTITSFEGVSQKVELSEADRGRTIIIKSGANQIAIYDCYGVTEVHRLNDKFLEIIYEQRGGSGYTPYNVLILCLSDGKLVTAMNTTYSAWTVGADAERKYSTKLLLKGGDKKGYKLLISISDRVTGKSLKWGGPYNKHQTVTLAFDPVMHLFYSGHKNLDQMFKFYGTPKQRHIKSVIPFIDINGEVSYFIDGLWYTLSHADDPPGPYQMKGDYLNAELTRIN